MFTMAPTTGMYIVYTKAYPYSIAYDFECQVDLLPVIAGSLPQLRRRILRRYSQSSGFLLDSTIYVSRTRAVVLGVIAIRTVFVKYLLSAIYPPYIDQSPYELLFFSAAPDVNKP